MPLIACFVPRRSQGTENMKVLSTGMWAIAFASQMCGVTHLYGFGGGSCLDACYHYYVSFLVLLPCDLPCDALPFLQCDTVWVDWIALRIVERREVPPA